MRRVPVEQQGRPARPASTEPAQRREAVRSSVEARGARRRAWGALRTPAPGEVGRHQRASRSGADGPQASGSMASGQGASAGRARRRYQEGRERRRGARRLRMPGEFGRGPPPLRSSQRPRAEVGRARRVWARLRRRLGLAKVGIPGRARLPAQGRSETPEPSVATSVCRPRSGPARVRRRAPAGPVPSWPAPAASPRPPAGRRLRSKPTGAMRIFGWLGIRRESSRKARARRRPRRRTPRRNSNTPRSRAGSARGPPIESAGRRWRKAGFRCTRLGAWRGAFRAWEEGLVEQCSTTPGIGQSN